MTDRYDLGVNDGEMYLTPDGEWIRWDDVSEAVAAFAVMQDMAAIRCQRCGRPLKTVYERFTEIGSRYGRVCVTKAEGVKRR